MCRWAAYIGEPIFLEDIVSAPGRSLTVQSLAARECKSGTNGDGFGVAWYGERPEPGLFRDVLPAWSDPNLKSLAQQVRSGLFLAHVRASTGTATSRNNCHPFACGRWSFMHNGQMGGYDRLRRRIDMLIPDELYECRKGATDSEALFLLALAEGMEADPYGAMLRATARLEGLAREAGVAPFMRLTAAFSDGERLFAVRYASDDEAPTLYHRFSRSRRGRAVVSEPLDADEGDWEAIPPGHFAEITAEGVRLRPFAPMETAASAA
ncbi:class II glutamine amidotransferase [Limibaculum sp. FT325]|uniref:class II glutamine amidotransferase n=1 Tax=Thermohalobaculum sediminis TaxID=2939436 RepID=UPI0020BF6189|nr:class II glutamine amidotransferase [Limibaculum sediminis]MCL5777270.1 class II glutamine amidotransferase [Limibaculum sediminis]